MICFQFTKHFTTIAGAVAMVKSTFLVRSDVNYAIDIMKLSKSCLFHSHSTFRLLKVYSNLLE